MTTTNDDELQGIEIVLNAIGVFLLFGGLISCIWLRETGVMIAVSSFIPFETARALYHSRMKENKNE